MSQETDCSSSLDAEEQPQDIALLTQPFASTLLWRAGSFTQAVSSGEALFFKTPLMRSGWSRGLVAAGGWSVGLPGKANRNP